VGALDAVLQQASGLGIHSDLMGDPAVPDVERISRSAGQRRLNPIKSEVFEWLFPRFFIGKQHGKRALAQILGFPADPESKRPAERLVPARQA
jgi:hypothetical protein